MAQVSPTLENASRSEIATAQIISGFISFGTLHIKTRGFEPWRWLMIITRSLTLLVALAFSFLFPDSPTNAWFLTPRERSMAVRRIKENQTDVENKHFEKELFEVLLDPKTWLSALLAPLDNVPNSLANQRQIIVSSSGFTAPQTTLLGCVDGAAEIAAIWTSISIASQFENNRAHVVVIYPAPNLVSVFMVNFLPWENKVGLLFSQWIIVVGVTVFAPALSWISSVTSGHTKVTVSAIMLSAYCIGDAAGPIRIMSHGLLLEFATFLAWPYCWLYDTSYQPRTNVAMRSSLMKNTNTSALSIWRKREL
ncbi:major facilitator superfamily domain-containing protein [Infundibulicybe gibba]|nr:major facilitator superfamily domain-containing protein [Infundibulicybe gibba]